MKEEKVTHQDGLVYVVQFEKDDNGKYAVYDIIKYKTGEVVTNEWFEDDVLKDHTGIFKETIEEQVNSLMTTIDL